MKSKSSIVVKGKGMDLSNQKSLLGRTKKKMIISKLILALIDASKKKKNQERIQAYWNTYHCQNRIYTSNGKLYGKYCKNRFCTTCCGIRKAGIINKYLPVIETWKQPYFVTLTQKAIAAKDLEKRMFDVLRAFRIIKNKYKKFYQRGKAIKLIGIKSLECNFNPIKKTYNPHLHLIVPDKETAEIIIAEWLSLWTIKFASPKAQDSRKVENLETALIEIIKYSSKIFTEPDTAKKDKQKVTPYIYVSALDNIIWGMKDLRIFERFGFNLPKPVKYQEKTITTITNYKNWSYDLNRFNWIDEESEQKLSEYLPSPDLNILLENYINIELE